MIEKLNTKDHLLKLEKFNENDDRLIFGEPTYYCEKCDDTTSFLLEMHKPFPEEAIEKEFSKIMPKPKNWGDGYTNFQCRLCKDYLRCLYEISEFRMSAYKFYPIHLYRRQKEKGKS